MSGPVRFHLDFAIRSGAFELAVSCQCEARVLGVFGPSGSGKTTCLEVIAGLRQPVRGRVAIGKRVLFDRDRRIQLPPRARRIGYVPQDALLFPHMDVRRNILYGARAAGDGTSFGLDSVLEVLEAGSLLNRRVTGLSGGERQRIALARALMSAPDLLLLDEPLASVDLPLRRRIVADLARVRDDLGVPAVYVTHDPEELRSLSDHAMVLREGKVVMAGPPSSLQMG